MYFINGSDNVFPSAADTSRDTTGDTTGDIVGVTAGYTEGLVWGGVCVLIALVMAVIVLFMSLKKRNAKHGGTVASGTKAKRQRGNI